MTEYGEEETPIETQNMHESEGQMMNNDLPQDVEGEQEYNDGQLPIDEEIELKKKIALYYHTLVSYCFLP
jgi:hypothetical protein